MGWSAGGEIFDPVARGAQKIHAYLVNIGRTQAAADRLVDEVLRPLITALQGHDWDTEEESLEEFADHPAIVAAFAAHNIYLPSDPRHPDHEAWKDDNPPDPEDAARWPFPAVPESDPHHPQP
jgi:hypothetical protein